MAAGAGCRLLKPAVRSSFAPLVPTTSGRPASTAGSPPRPLLGGHNRRAGRRAGAVHYLAGGHYAGVESGGLALVLAQLPHQAVLQQGAQLGKLRAQAGAGRFAGNNNLAGLGLEVVEGG